jgi:hypothetical protein
MKKTIEIAIQKAGLTFTPEIFLNNQSVGNMFPVAHKPTAVMHAANFLTSFKDAELKLTDGENGQEFDLKQLPDGFEVSPRAKCPESLANDDDLRSMQVALTLCGYVFTPAVIHLVVEVYQMQRAKGDSVTIDDIKKIQDRLAKLYTESGKIPLRAENV